MKFVTRNPNKLKKNISIESDYKELIILEKIINAIDLELSHVLELAKDNPTTHYGPYHKFQGSLVYGLLFRVMNQSLGEIRNSREKINKKKSVTGIKITERKIINELKIIIDCGYRNYYTLSRCQALEQEIEIRTKYGRSFEITARIPLVPARNAIHSGDGFIPFAKALNESERHNNFFMLGVTDMYVDTNDSVGDIRLGLITYFQTGKNDRSKGIQYAWMCMSKGKVCVVGLANDPVHAERRMVRSAAGIMREKIKEENKS